MGAEFSKGGCVQFSFELPPSATSNKNQAKSHAWMPAPVPRCADISLIRGPVLMGVPLGDGTACDCIGGVGGGGGGGGREGDCCCKSQILVLKTHLAQPRGGDNFSFCPGEQSALTVLGCSGGSLTPREGAGLYCTTWRSLILARIPVAPVQKQEASTGHSCYQVVQRSHFWQNSSVATFVPITLHSLSFLRCWYLPVTL